MKCLPVQQETMEGYEAPSAMITSRPRHLDATVVRGNVPGDVPGEQPQVRECSYNIIMMCT